MGMSTDCYYGYGFFTSSYDGEKVKQFIRNHIDTCGEIGWDKEDLLNTLNGEDFDISTDLEADADWGYCYDGAISLVSNIMSKETGIRFSAECNSEEGEMAIMLLESLPWDWNEVELKLTKESLLEILKKYTDELGFDSSKIDFIKIETWG